eukprot:3594961-Prymnesium_polylepis.1
MKGDICVLQRIEKCDRRKAKAASKLSKKRQSHRNAEQANTVLQLSSRALCPTWHLLWSRILSDTLTHVLQCAESIGK